MQEGPHETRPFGPGVATPSVCQEAAADPPQVKLKLLLGGKKKQSYSAKEDANCM